MLCFRSGIEDFFADIGKAVTGEGAGEQQKAALLRQARLAELEGSRQVRDEKVTQSLRMSRMLALAGAGGRGADLIGDLSRDASESGLRLHRIKSNTKLQAASLRHQGQAAKLAAEPTIWDALSIGTSLANTGQAVTSAGSQVSSLFSSGTTITPTTPAFRKTSTGRLGGPV